MRVLYDGTIYTMQKAGGISRYFASIISRLPESVTPTIFTGPLETANAPQHKNLRLPRRQFSFRPGRIAHKLQVLHDQSINDSRHYDIAHPTYYNLLSGREVSDYSCPVVLTVYDMIHEIYREQVLSTAQQVIDSKRKAVAAAQAILCISECTKQDLIKFYSVPEEKIVVTYLASDTNIEMSYGQEPVPDAPYFLHVGTRDTYKNFKTLLTAFAKASLPDVVLAVVGYPFTDAELRQIHELKLNESVVNVGFVDDNCLAKLYRCSLALVYPSLYEGFGIPPLEAMACGTVVVASDRSSIPEVVGNAAILFNPDNADELADILMSISTNPDTRPPYIERGFERARQFSWAKTAEQTVRVYEQLAQ